MGAGSQLLYSLVAGGAAFCVLIFIYATKDKKKHKQAVTAVELFKHIQGADKHPLISQAGKERRKEKVRK